jgi:hypothetical protein
MNITTAISTLYSFPPSFKPYENEAFIDVLTQAFDRVSLSKIVETLRDVDHTATLAQNLQTAKTAIDYVRFQNSYRAEEVFTTSNKGDVASMRRTLQSAAFKFDAFLGEVTLVVQTQMFLLKHTASAEINEQTKTLNAFNEQIDTQDMIRAQLAIDNLKALHQYYSSLSASSAMKTLMRNVQIIANIAPVVSLGSKKFSQADDKAFEWLDVVNF